MAKISVIAVGMGNNGPVHRLPRIDVEFARRAAEAERREGGNVVVATIAVKIDATW